MVVNNSPMINPMSNDGMYDCYTARVRRKQLPLSLESFVQMSPIAADPSEAVAKFIEATTTVLLGWGSDVRGFWATR